jgi:hypothetical protein
MRRVRRTAACERGQASVELVAALPAVLCVGLLVWQLALAGHAAWLCANAARVAARAELVGRDAEVAARSAVPGTLERGMRVERSERGLVRVQLRVPVLLRRWRSPVTVAASASLEAGR